jgi:hypothetical protein
MDGDDDRAVTGQDVLAAVAVAGLGAAVSARLLACIAVGDRFRDASELAAAAGPPALGISDGRWNAVFPPLFGEFE